MPLDPSLGGARTGAKLGFDCTIPFGKANTLEFSVPTAPVAPKGPRHASVAAALAAGPASFLELMAALGSKDGREVACALDELRQAGRLSRDRDGRYYLGKAKPGLTGIVGELYRDPNEGA